MQKLWIAMIALALAAPFSAFSQEKGDMGNMGDSAQMKKEHERKDKRIGRRKRPSDCKLAERVARKRGEKCLRVKKNNTRKRCFDRVGNYLERKFGEKCMSQIEPIRRELEKREGEKYGKNSFGDMKGDQMKSDQMKSDQMKKPMGSNQDFDKKHDPMVSGQRDQNPPHKKASKDHKKGPDCNSIENNTRKKVEKCMSIKNQRKRRMCFHNLQKYINQRYNRECVGRLQPIYDRLKPREMEEHPNNDEKDIGHVDAIERDNIDNIDKKYKKLKKACRVIAERVRKKGHQCLRKKSQGKRRSCFNKIGSFVRKVKGGQCEGVFEPMKQIFMEEERVIYPKQESGVL